MATRWELQLTDRRTAQGEREPARQHTGPLGGRSAAGRRCLGQAAAAVRGERWALAWGRRSMRQRAVSPAAGGPWTELGAAARGPWRPPTAQTAKRWWQRPWQAVAAGLLGKAAASGHGAHV